MGLAAGMARWPFPRRLKTLFYFNYSSAPHAEYTDYAARRCVAVLPRHRVADAGGTADQDAPGFQSWLS